MEAKLLPHVIFNFISAVFSYLTYFHSFLAFFVLSAQWARLGYINKYKIKIF